MRYIAVSLTEATAIFAKSALKIQINAQSLPRQPLLRPRLWKATQTTQNSGCFSLQTGQQLQNHTNMLVHEVCEMRKVIPCVCSVRNLTHVYNSLFSIPQPRLSCGQVSSWCRCQERLMVRSGLLLSDLGFAPAKSCQVAPSHAKPTRWSARCGCCGRKLVNPAGPLPYHPLRTCSSGKMKVRRIGQSWGLLQAMGWISDFEDFKVFWSQSKALEEALVKGLLRKSRHLGWSYPLYSELWVSLGK